VREDPRGIEGDRPMLAPSAADETFVTVEKMAIGSAVSSKRPSWSPEGCQAMGAAPRSGPDSPNMLPTSPRRGATRNRNREIAGDQQKPILSAADETLLTDEELAARWHVSPKTLRNARVAGRLVGFIKIGRSVRYRMSEVIAFEEQNSKRSTSGDEE